MVRGLESLYNSHFNATGKLAAAESRTNKDSWRQAWVSLLGEFSKNLNGDERNIYFKNKVLYLSEKSSPPTLNNINHVESEYLICFLVGWMEAPWTI